MFFLFLLIGLVLAAFVGFTIPVLILIALGLVGIGLQFWATTGRRY
jgi:hypothetical protein